MQYVLYKEYSQRFISYSETGKVIHVSTLEKAHKFDTRSRAKEARKNASKKTHLFDIYIITDNGTLEKASINTSKRKSFSVEERKQIYKKTQGHCYLCGDFVDFDAFEVEHKIPLGKGGTNDFDNLFPSCHCCNQIKHDIYPADFMERISKIYMFQMKKKYHGTFRWKIIYRLLEKMT